MSEKKYIERYWRDAKPEDAIKDPPMVARFKKDGNENEWTIGKLHGIDRKPLNKSEKWFGDRRNYGICQVYDAPDPGEGWRLIDPDKDDYQQDGIEYQNLIEKKWIPRTQCNKTRFQDGFVYRIRITPAVKYVPFTWEDREELRGRWVRCVDAPENEWAISSMYIGSGGELRANGVPADRLASGFIFLDTGEPVGKKVQA